ncbi:MAG TPA: hypothetical protein VF459_12235 [Caulobacteraceae bacterium]
MTNGVQISAWEDDPGNGVPGDGVRVTRPAPDVGRAPLAFSFPAPAPAAAVYQPGTPEFRYWTAAEALRRGADFWAALVPLTRWHIGDVLPVLLDEGEDLNAYYDRQALNFFHGDSPDGTVYSGESPDIICHEMGHAILDTIKPQLWGAASHETAAFHESFADISGILSALQLPSLRTAILADTRGQIYRASRLSRLAEQLGAAIRAVQPDAVESDCLRNAVNSFTYEDPVDLPPGAPASQLSSEAHSFSRLFTGAAFEILGGLLNAQAAGGAPTEAQLLAVGNDLGRILVDAVKAAAVVPNWYAQVAAGMVQTSAAVNPAYPPIVKAVFVRRGILSLHSAAQAPKFANAVNLANAVGVVAAAAPSPSLGVHLALPAEHYGLDEPLLVEPAAQQRPFMAMSAAGDATSLQPASSSRAATSYVDDLFRRGRVDYAGQGKPEHQLNHGRRLRSHRVVKDHEGLKLQRVLFDCGLCCR